MNANPSGSRTPSTGCRGESEARRELAAATGPSPGLARVAVRAGIVRPGDSTGGWLERRDAARQDGVSWGPQPRGAPPKEGSGTRLTPRHIARHLVPHLLLSANTSAPADAVRPRFPDRGTALGSRRWSTVRNAASQAKAQPAKWSLASSTRRVTPSWSSPAPTSRPTSACGQSRGKGVLAA